MERGLYGSIICPLTKEAVLNNYFFYQLTGYKKYALTLEEYQVLTDPNNIQMVIFYQYLLYIIYRRCIPCTPSHFQYMTNMLEKVESITKKKEKQKQLIKNKSISVK